ncbi:nucleotide pyrophosphohydrolase [Undibacterium sp. Di27W]|uniref:nucleotide pyrophosphohydrolase n=1 Tax=Undibacterium sp. Di27W TaxID=3413036 RepID=UPI003BF2FB4E
MQQATPAVDQYTEIRRRLREFVAERDWAQFHTPKNLASALTVEAAELLEIFQWLPTGKAEELDEQARTAIRHEMADVLNYLVMLADALDVDLFAASMEKIVLNGLKYPALQVKGDARKYSAYAADDKKD